MEYEIVIGLEVHVELSTKTKIYCSCTTEFGGDVNTHCCPICVGMPGVLPVLNKKVIEYAVKAGLATNCSITQNSKQDRKNYFYPDLPKAYQISQLYQPICKNGFVEINVGGNVKKIGISEIHIEEDAGKLVHDQWDTGSLVDYNRCGVPLIEIVSTPDMRNAEEVKTYLENLKAILQYIEVSDCKMQEGSLRADVNLSVRPMGQEEFGTRTEMKNLNSFKSIVRAIESESRRQIEEIESGGRVIQETRRWDDNKGISYAMRSKEDAHDYRYFPDPDLVPIVIENSEIEEIKASLPELPEARKKRYVDVFGLPEYDAWQLTNTKVLSDFFEEAVNAGGNAKICSNWIMGEMMKLLKDRDIESEGLPFGGENLAKMVQMIEKGTINGTIAKRVFEKMFSSGKNPEDIVKEEGLQTVSDVGAIKDMVIKILTANPQSVADFKSGKEKAFAFLVGQAMREAKGKADPQVVNQLLKHELEK